MLLDEADVFLEKRNSLDMIQHSMVCVMLRLLEYHPGILFLTTNHVREFDPAIESRVTVALHYQSLTLEARIQIWKTLLKLVSIEVDSNVDFDALGRHVLNGREIKNVVRLGVALAKDQQIPALDQDILELALQTASLGRQGLSIPFERESI